MVFLSTYTNKIDSKGRVSVPASYRHALAKEDFNGVIVVPSFKFAAIEAFGMSQMEKILSSVESLDMFSDEQDHLKTALFAAAKELNFDSDGRILLPENMREMFGFKDQATFVGTGKSFQIWLPDQYQKHQQDIMQKLRKSHPTLKTEGLRKGENP